MFRPVHRSISRTGAAKAEYIILLGFALIGTATAVGVLAQRLANRSRAATAALDGVEPLGTTSGKSEDAGTMTGGTSTNSGGASTAKPSTAGPQTQPGKGVPLGPPTKNNPLNPQPKPDIEKSKTDNWAGIPKEEIEWMERNKSPMYADAGSANNGIVNDAGSGSFPTANYVPRVPFYTPHPKRPTFTPWKAPVRPTTPPVPQAGTPPLPDSPDKVNPGTPTNPVNKASKSGDRHYARNKNGGWTKLNQPATQVANRANPENKSKTGGAGTRRQTNNLTKNYFTDTGDKTAYQGKNSKITYKGAAGLETKAMVEVRTTGKETVVRAEIGGKSGIHGEINGSKFWDISIGGQKVRVQVDGKAEGFFGSELKGTGTAHSKKGTKAAYAKVEGFSGAKVGASFGVRLLWLDPASKKFIEIGSGTLLGEGGAGAGGSIEMRFGYDKGKIKFRAGLSGFVGLGAGAKVDGMLDGPSAARFVKTVTKQAVKRTWQGAKNTAKKAVQKVKDALRKKASESSYPAPPRDPYAHRPPMGRGMW